MHTIKTPPFDKEELLSRLQSAFPNYTIKKSFGNANIRTKSFTVTGHVGLNLNPTKGTIRTQTHLDMAPVYLLFCFPLAIYIFAKARKIKSLEQEIVKKVNEILLETATMPFAEKHGV